MSGIYNFLAGLASGALGAMGLGGGGVLILYLTLILGLPQIAAQGINLIFFIPVAAVSVLIYSLKKQIRWRFLLPLIIAGLPGALFGFMLGSFLGTEWTARIFGIGLVIMGAKELLFKVRSKR